MVLCSPNWGAHGSNEYWRNLLDRLTISSVRLPDEATYVPLGRKTPIGKPGWGSMLSLVDGGLTSIPWEDLDPTLVQAIQRESDGLALGDLKDRLRPQDAFETIPGGDEYIVTDTNAPNYPCHVPVPDGVSECGLSELPSSIHSDDKTEHDAFFVQTCVEEVDNAEYVAPLKPLLSMRVEHPMDEELDPRSRLREYVDSKRKFVAKKLCYTKPTRSSWPLKQGRMGDLSQLKEDLEQKITTWHREVDLKLMKSVWGAHVRTPEEDDLSEKCVCEAPRACLCCHRPSEMVEQDLLYAYQGLKDTTKGKESVEDHLPTSITRGASNLHSDEAYILHYIYSYLTQGQPEQGLIALSPQAKHIISKRIGVYATPILQPTTPVAPLATGLAIYAYLPMNPCRLPQPLPADQLFFTDASDESALTPITGGATLQLTHTGGHYHMDHHTGHTTNGASSHGELGAMADAIAEIAAHLPAHLPHIVRVWFVVDATVDTHLLLRKARQTLHKATATSLGTQALLLWKALRSLPPYVQLHIVKQESHRHQYGNGKVDNQAVHQRTTHLPALQILDLGRNHTHLQHIPPLPEPHQTPDWVSEDAPYSSHDRAYHYCNPIQHLAHVLGDADSRAHIQELQDRLQIPLYNSAYRPANVPAHLQKRRIQLLREQLPFLTRVARWLARKHIHVPEEHTRCPCDHTTPEDWEHFKKCPLHTGRDTLVGWSPAETLRQHQGWPTHSHAHQASEHLFRDPLVKEATSRGAVTQALHRHLTKHTESPMEAAAHLKLEAVRRAAAQMVHPKHLLLTHAEQLTDPTAREHMQCLINYHAVHDSDVL